MIKLQNFKPVTIVVSASIEFGVQFRITKMTLAFFSSTNL